MKTRRKVNPNIWLYLGLALSIIAGSLYYGLYCTVMYRIAQEVMWVCP